MCSTDRLLSPKCRNTRPRGVSYLARRQGNIAWSRPGSCRNAPDTELDRSRFHGEAPWPNAAWINPVDSLMSRTINEDLDDAR